MAERFSTGLRNNVLRSGGDSFADTLANGIFRVFTGSQPATADAVETGTLLGSFTIENGAFTPGIATNGINFDVSTGGVLAKKTTETWRCVTVAAGTAGWGRFYANDMATGASTTAKRFDISISVTGGAGDVQFANVTWGSGATVTLDSFTVNFPSGA